MISDNFNCLTLNSLNVFLSTVMLMIEGVINFLKILRVKDLDFLWVLVQSRLAVDPRRNFFKGIFFLSLNLSSLLKVFFPVLFVLDIF